METLPLDILVQVLSFIDPRPLLRVARLISRRFNQAAYLAVDSISFLQPHLTHCDIPPWVYATKCEKGHALQWRVHEYYQSFSYACDICLSGAPTKQERWCCPTCDYDVCLDCVAAPAAPSSLMSDDLVRSSDVVPTRIGPPAGLIEFAARFTRVTKWTLNRAVYIPPAAICHRLTTLRLYGLNAQRVNAYEHLNSLTDITFPSLRGFRDLIVVKRILHQNSTSIVTLSGASNCNERLLENFMLPQLRSLSYDPPNGLTPEATALDEAFISDHLRQLTKLVFSPHLESEALLLRNWDAPNLRALNLYWPHLTPIEHLLNFLVNCTRLTSMTLDMKAPLSPTLGTVLAPFLQSLTVCRPSEVELCTKLDTLHFAPSDLLPLNLVVPLYLAIGPRLKRASLCIRSDSAALLAQFKSKCTNLCRLFVIIDNHALSSGLPPAPLNVFPMLADWPLAKLEHLEFATVAAPELATFIASLTALRKLTIGELHSDAEQFDHLLAQCQRQCVTTISVSQGTTAQHDLIARRYPWLSVT